jgi:anti-sigma B factor antagonist
MVTGIAEATTAEEAAAAAPDPPKTTAPLKLTHHVHSAGQAIVDLRGELDIATAAMAVSYVIDVIDNHHGPVTVNLTALAFCDAQGLAALVRMANHAKHQDRPFQIASPRPSLVKIMRITGLDRRFLTPKR